MHENFELKVESFLYLKKFHSSPHNIALEKGKFKRKFSHTKIIQIDFQVLAVDTLIENR